MLKCVGYDSEFHPTAQVWVCRDLAFTIKIWGPKFSETCLNNFEESSRHLSFWVTVEHLYRGCQKKESQGEILLIFRNYSGINSQPSHY